MDSVDPIGRTVLHFAAAIGNLQIIKLLIENGVSINSTDKHGNTALHEAAWKGYSQTIQLLCKSKADLRLQNKSGNTPLHLACQRGHNQSCRTLLIYGRQKHQIHRLKNNFGDTSLHTAARYGHAGALRILISAFCSVNEINENGDTALHISAAMGRRKLTKILLEAGCDTTIKNKQGETASDIATRKGFKEVQEMITKAPVVKDLPVDPNAKPGASKASSSQESSKSRRAKHRLKKELQKSRHKSCHDSPYGCPLAPDVKELCKTPTKSPPSDPLKKGEQYYIDLAGNVRKGPVGKSVCFCSPLFEEFEKKLTKDKKELKEQIDCCHDNLDKKIDNLEEKTSHQLVTLNEAIKSKIANERSQCIERSQRSNLKQRIDFERSQSQQVEQLKSQMKFWLESKLGSAILRRQERNLQFISNPSNLDSSSNVPGERMQLSYSNYSHLGMIPEPITPDGRHFMVSEHESSVKSVTQKKYERSQSCLGSKDCSNHVPNFSKSKSETHLALSQIPLDEYKRDPFFIEPGEEDIVRAEVYHYDNNSGSEDSITGDQNDSERTSKSKYGVNEISQRYQANDVPRNPVDTTQITCMPAETDNTENPSVSGSVKDLMKSLRCDPLAISEFDYRNSPFSDSGFRSKYSPSPRECPVGESSLYSNHVRDSCIVPSDPPIGLPPPPPTYESCRRFSMPRELHTRAMVFSSDGNIVMAKDIEKMNANIEKIYVTQQQFHQSE